MYTDIIACYFVKSVLENIYNRNITEYKKNIIFFKKGFADKEHRHKMYQQIFKMCKDKHKDLTFNDFLQTCIGNFYKDFELEENNLFTLFDRTVQNGVNEWVNFIHVYEADNVVKGTVDLIEARTKFLYYLSISINQIILAFNDEEITHTNKQYKQLLDYLLFLKKETKNVSTQTYTF